MRLTWPSLLLALAALTHARALAQPAAPLWPPDCTRDMPRDGLVLLDPSALGVAPAAGVALSDALEVRLLRSADGAEVAGALEPPGGGSAALLRWRSRAPLEAHTEYKIETRRKSAAGTAPEPGLSGYFTTGDSFLAPLAFSGRPAVRLLARALEPEAGAAPEVLLVRIALPPLSGGLAQRTLRVTATWSERDERQPVGLRAHHERAALPGETLGFELEAQLGDTAHERCLQIAARDDLGQELVLDPELCVSLPADSAAEPTSATPEPDPTRPDDTELETWARVIDGADAELESPASHQAVGTANTAAHSDGASGCTLSRGRTAPRWYWLLAALPALLRRRRVRVSSG